MVSAVSAVAAAVGGGGAVTGAVDCCYGPGKISLPVIKISKKKKRQYKKTHRGLETSVSRVLHFYPRIRQ